MTRMLTALMGCFLVLSIPAAADFDPTRWPRHVQEIYAQFEKFHDYIDNYDCTNISPSDAEAGCREEVQDTGKTIADFLYRIGSAGDAYADGEKERYNKLWPGVEEDSREMFSNAKGFIKAYPGG